MDIKSGYATRYAAQSRQHLYPVEWVVRAFLGAYPNLKLPRDYSGQTVLDLGFGDGRNLLLLHNLGFAISGVEISEEITRDVTSRMRERGITTDLRVGSNARIPFDTQFDCVVACHACYYVEQGTSFDNNLAELRRVLKPDGLLVCSLPMLDTYILAGSEPLGKGHFRLTQDPYGVRVGTIFRAFADEKEIQATFVGFRDFRIGFTDDD
jgi:SAM-dependent methyltransferase